MNAAIVVLYETQRKNIENIKQYYDKVDLMVILDNSRIDNYNTVNEIIDIDEKKTLYKHFEKNIGLCAALNIGMKIAEEFGCDWALIMDDDSSLITDIIQVYKKFIFNNNVADIAVLSPIHIFDRRNAYGYIGNKQINWAMTSGCYYNIKIFQRLGGFFEALFVECLDLDYCYRALENGYIILECGEAQLNHHPAETRTFSIFGKNILSYGVASPWRYYMQARNLTWIFLRYRHLTDLVTYIWKIIKVILFFDKKKEYIRQMNSGRKEGKILYKYYKNKNRR